MSSSFDTPHASTEEAPCPFRPGRTPLTGFLAFLSSFTPLSTDMYMPALPSMAHVFAVSAEHMNLSISLFMLCFALSMPFWGPLSDRYGRRPVLFCGAGLYVVSSLACAWTGDINLFIACRCLQAIGGGALGTVSMAVVKDVYHGRTMENMLATLQVILVIAPMTAPLLGGLILRMASWRMLFVALAACGAIGFAGTLLLAETNHSRDRDIGMGQSLGKVYTVFRERVFRRFVLIFSLPSISFMSYLTSSSYVYISMFGLSPQGYSLYFSFNAGASVLGPLVYVRFLRDISRKRLFAGVFFLLVVVGLLYFVFGESGPVTFTLISASMALLSNIMRPPATMVLMNLRDSDNGTVASLIGCTGLLFGSMGMLACSLPFPSPVIAVGSIVAVSSTAGLLGWLASSHMLPGEIPGRSRT